MNIKVITAAKPVNGATKDNYCGCFVDDLDPPAAGRAPIKKYPFKK